MDRSEQFYKSNELLHNHTTVSFAGCWPQRGNLDTTELHQRVQVAYIARGNRSRLTRIRAQQ